MLDSLKKYSLIIIFYLITIFVMFKLREAVSHENIFGP